MSEIKKQIPNILSLIRIPLAILCGYFAFTMKPLPLSISLILFLVASFTDYLDGYLARRWNIVSTFGKIIDPIADKVLIIGVFLVFTYNGLIPILLTALIVIREIVLTIIRLLLLPKKVVLAARFSGKVKTFSQFVVLVIIYLMLIFWHPLQGSIYESMIRNAIFVLAAWTMIITLYSGYEFWMANRKVIEKIELI